MRVTIPLLKSEELKHALSERKVIVFENIQFPIITPDEIRELYQTTTDGFRHLSDDKISAWVSSNSGHRLDAFKSLDEFTKTQMHLYYSTKDERGFGRHRDASDVLFIQIFGSTRWVVEDYANKEIHDVCLEPNDAILIPHRTLHTVTNLTDERAGLSISVGNYHEKGCL
jgi:mannose-6-phosphate isomerase-like protein (cupin superfamily)